MSIHEGHRQRMKDRFFYEKMDHFSDHEVLELLLYYAIPRKDTNPIAHALISHFGSLPQVLDASVEELEQVDGISRNAAVLLKLVTEMGRYYEVERKRQTRILKSVEECGNYLLPRFFGRVNETVFLLCLDARCKVLSCREVGEGSINSANVSIRRIVEMALASKASSVVLAHNHPSGIALPSAEDRATTRRVAAALSLVDVVLVDHIIVADHDFVSLADSGYLM
jgi:DNA repair protein RadC